MPRKIYTAADHQKAFEVWYKTRNWSTVAKTLDANWSTTKRWSEETFPCSWGCSWHGYDQLIADRDKAHQARMELLDQGNYDPVDHELAMRDAIAKKDPQNNVIVSETSMKIVRSDLERLQHWELLWSKVYFHATGVVTTWREYAGFDTMPEYERLELKEKVRQALTQGLAATSLEQCIRMLKTIQDQIDGLQGARRRTASTSGDPAKKEMTIQELRQLRRHLQNTPPSKLATMLTVVNSDAPPDSRTG